MMTGTAAMVCGITRNPMGHARFTSRWPACCNGYQLAESGKFMNILPKLNRSDLICLSHLRWNFVFQRPQHLMSRFARARRVFFVEEPVFDSAKPQLKVTVCPHTN